MSAKHLKCCRLEGEFWGPTVDLLLDENVKESRQL